MPGKVAGQQSDEVAVEEAMDGCVLKGMTAAIGCDSFWLAEVLADRWIASTTIYFGGWRSSE